ncbi:hypothetical protein KOW79_005241 [Hemibagrus wyckioides]|uniref:Uncharacterized protein n=1 Tax=Hemibagrus wyckioides TaxID=337641 RepID=A0A9D3NZ70_9TELE|nr:hypothetical protein KOW79_005241 [Hemibagrus wyckioides]
MCHWVLNGKRQPHRVSCITGQLAMIASTAQGLKSAKLAEGGQLWGREDWQLQASRGDRGAVSPWSSNLPPGGEKGRRSQLGGELSLPLEGISLLLLHCCHLDPLTARRSWHRAKL